MYLPPINLPLNYYLSHSTTINTHIHDKSLSSLVVYMLDGEI